MLFQSMNAFEWNERQNIIVFAFEKKRRIGGQTALNSAFGLSTEKSGKTGVWLLSDTHWDAIGIQYDICGYFDIQSVPPLSTLSGHLWRAFGTSLSFDSIKRFYCGKRVVLETHWMAFVQRSEKTDNTYTSAESELCYHLPQKATEKVKKVSSIWIEFCVILQNNLFALDVIKKSKIVDS